MGEIHLYVLRICFGDDADKDKKRLTTSKNSKMTSWRENRLGCPCTDFVTKSKNQKKNIFFSVSRFCHKCDTCTKCDKMWHNRGDKREDIFEIQKYSKILKLKCFNQKRCQSATSAKSAVLPSLSTLSAVRQKLLDFYTPIYGRSNESFLAYPSNSIGMSSIVQQ